MPGQCAAGEPRARLGVQRGLQLVAAGGLAGEVGHHTSPLPAGGAVEGQLVQQRRRDMQLHDPALHPPRRWVGTGDPRAAPGDPGEQEVAVVVDDAEAPLRAAALRSHRGARHVRCDRA